MGNFKWLQISDLHFSTRDSFDMSFARQGLLDCLEDLVDKGIKPDYVFITGDIADKNDYSSSKEYIEKLLKAIGFNKKADKKRVFWSVGNHDIERSKTGFRKQIIKTIRDAEPPSTPSKEFETAMLDHESRMLLTQTGMANYIKEYKNILDRELTADQISDAHILYDNLKELNLVILNTCLTSCDNDDHHKLMITEQKLFQLFDKIKNKDKPIIVIGHHGKMFFHSSEQDRLAHLFEDAGVDLYLCGHSHRLGYDRFDDSGRDIPQITCGGGNISDGSSVFTFIVGDYNALDKAVTITPYSYRETRQFRKDDNLCRRLNKFNNTFPLSRLIAPDSTDDDSSKPSTKNKAGPKISLQDADLFARSESHYQFMGSEQGRFSFLKINEEMLAHVKVKGADDDTSIKVSEILRQAEENVLIMGDGGMGKTTSLLHAWKKHLEAKVRLPLYIPLNDYRQQKDFICDYIKNYYGNIDLMELDRDFLLLLDGFNEISGTTHLLIAELKTMLLKHGNKRIRVMITSRHDFIEDYQLDAFKSYQLLPLDKEVVEEVVRDDIKGESLPLDEATIEVLKTPMMLSLYTETCNIQLNYQIKDKGYFPFKENKRRGEMLYNYLLCQVAKLVISGKLEEVASTWYTLFSVAPYIAYEMESTGKFHIDKKSFEDLEKAYQKRSIDEYLILSMPDPLKKLLHRSGGLASQLESAENILLYRQYLLVEENKNYSFRHQHFRDFFAMLHIANTVERTIEVGKGVEMEEVAEAMLPSVLTEKPWSIYVQDMLGDYYGDYKNKVTYCHHTSLHELLGILRNRTNAESKLAVNNVLETWRRCRDDRIIGENLTNLDLSRVPLNGVVFYNHRNITDFSGSKISDATLLAQGHSNIINSAIYSPDGQKILSASDDNTIKEWDQETGECLRTFKGHLSGVTMAIYSPDSQKILSVSKSGIIKEWDRETGACIHTFGPHSGDVTSVIYSSDGQKILSASRDCTIKEWDRETGECLQTFFGHSNDVFSAIYSSDGKKILSSSRDRTIKEWDQETGLCMNTFKGYLSAIYSPDGKKILFVSDDNIIEEWDQVISERLQTFKGHSSDVFSAIYSPDGQKILSASGDHTIKEWDRETGECLRNFEGDSGNIFSAIYSRDGQKTLSASWDNTIKEWNQATGECLRTFVGHSSRVYSAIYNSDSKKILSASDDSTIKEWDRETGKCLRTFEGHSSSVYSAIYSCDNQKILSASGDMTIKEWDRITGECLRTFEGHSSRVYSAIYSPDGKKILSASADYTIKEWNQATEECLRTFEGHSHNIFSAIYSPDGKKILSASWDSTAKEWDQATEECLFTFEGYSSYVFSAIYSPDGKKILASSLDDTIIEWDQATGECLQTFFGHSNAVFSAIYSPDGQKILSASGDSTIKEWNQVTGECEWTITSHGGVFIMDCNFKGCHFTTLEIERLVQIYGGKVQMPVLRSIKAEYLHGQKREIAIELGDDSPVNLVITGPNGSGKTSLLNGINQTIEALLEGGQSSEVAVIFSKNNPVEAIEVLKSMHRAGKYQLVYFDNVRTHNGNFFDKLDKAGNDVDRLRYEKNYEKANELNAWIERAKRVLIKLFDDKSLDFSFEKEKPDELDKKYKISYMLGDKKVELKRDQLPHGYSSILEIYSRILAQFSDNLISPSRYNGLVLIDELESHLHVSLQKRIFPSLMGLFPGIQFILTTHSPFIINSAKNSVVYDMQKQVVRSELTAYSYKGLIEHYFNEDMYSQEVKDKYNRYMALIAKSKPSQEEKKELEKIRAYFSTFEKGIADELLLAFRLKELERGEY